MISKTFTFILLSAFLSISLSASIKDHFFPKTRSIDIKPVTESIIEVLPGRAVKFIFPWILNEDDGELPFLVTLSNDVYFNKPIVKSGQNVLVMTFKQISKDMQGEVTDLLISSRGYHFSFTLRANFQPSQHYSTIILNLTETDRIALIDRELEKVNQTLIKEKARLESEIDDRAKVQALALVGGLSLEDPDSTSIKEEVKFKLPNGDNLVGYVEGYDNFGSFYNFRIEIENESNKSTYIKSLQLASVDEHGNKKLFPSSYLFKPKLKAGETAKGTLSTLYFIQSDDFNTALLISTDQGDFEVIF